MELAAGAPLFERFVYADPNDETAYEVDFARALEDAVSIMRHRQARLRGPEICVQALDHRRRTEKATPPGGGGGVGRH